MRYVRFAPALLAVGLVALAFAFFANSASADNIIVTREDDPTPDGCNLNGCSFREAVDLGNTTPGNQVIDIADLEITLDSTVTISGDLTVQGVNWDASKIRANNGAHLFNIQDNANATFNSVWLYGSSNAGPGTCGGSIYNTGAVQLINTRIAKNYITGRGAGLCNFGTATLNNVYMSANGATNGPGGAIYNDGTMTITDSTLTQNNVDGDRGGAIANDTDGELLLEHVTIDDNTAATNACDDCASGGGIWNAGTITIRRTNIRANTADNGAGLLNRGDATIERSTFSGNQAGAINNADGTMLITRSTISNNFGGPYPDSGVGGVSNYDTLSLVNVTIADNTAQQFQYGGVFTNTTASTSYKSSIIANSGAWGCSSSGNQVSFGYNVFAPDASNKCATVGTDKVVGNAGIAALADNGGPTFTNLPLNGGAAIDAGGPGCPAPDQRGALISDTHCDAGATEASGTPPTASPSPSPTNAPVSFPMGDFNCSDAVDANDLVPGLEGAAGLRAPDDCGRGTLGCFNYNSACWPRWWDPNCDEMVTPLDILYVAAHAAGAPMPANGCTPVGQYIVPN